MISYYFSSDMTALYVNNNSVKQSASARVLTPKGRRKCTRYKIGKILNDVNFKFEVNLWTVLHRVRDSWIL